MTSTSTLVTTIQRTLGSLAPEANRVLVAASGGSDSVGLLLALHEMQSVAVAVAHLDHAMRDASAQEAHWLAHLCRDLEIPFHTTRIDVPAIVRRSGGNVEEVARTVRYTYLTRAAKENACDVVATAHTRDDQAETVLMQLLRGSAHPRGIEPRRGRIVRPLLDVSRDDIRGWLDGKGQSWCDDVSNRDVARERAWIRHEVLPRFERRRAGSTVRLARFGHLQRDQADHLRDEAQRRFGSGPLARAALASAPRAVQREALTNLVRAGGGDVTGAHLELLLDDVSGHATMRRDLPGGVRVRFLRDVVDLVPVRPTDGSERPAPRIVDTAEDLPAGASAALLANGALLLRTPERGDRIAMAAGHRLVSDVLAEAGVPREARSSWPVLARGDAIVWIEGIASEAGVDHAEGDDDHRFMRDALTLARAAGEAGETPIGAVVVRGGRTIGQGANARETSGDPTDHAEIVAMRAAARHDGDWRLTGATLYVTVEPCPMCAGAILESHLARVVWGAPNPRDGAFGSVVDLSAGPFKRKPSRRAGVLAREARHLLETAFAASRQAEGDP